VPAVCDCEPCCPAELALLAVLEAAPELFCFAFLPPAPTVAGAWVDVAAAPALWSVEALCTVDCDCPPLEPPVCTCVLLWLVELSLLADADELFELV
jgi:hypothetical protein